MSPPLESSNVTPVIDVMSVLSPALAAFRFVRAVTRLDKSAKFWSLRAAPICAVVTLCGFDVLEVWAERSEDDGTDRFDLAVAVLVKSERLLDAVSAPIWPAVVECGFDVLEVWAESEAVDAAPIWPVVTLWGFEVLTRWLDNSGCVLLHAEPFHCSNVLL